MPVGLGLLLDVSDSMFGKRIKDARAAVDRFLFDLLDPSDEFFVFAFNHRPKPLTAWTHAQQEVQQQACPRESVGGGTAIYDTILESLPLMARRSKQRAAILVISDGADTASNASMRDVKSALLRSDAFVYAIAIDSPERQADQHAGQRRHAPRPDGRKRRPDRGRPQHGEYVRRDRADRRGN